MFGGVGLGASLFALEKTTRAPVIWASAHFLNFARPPQTLALEVNTHKSGRFIEQTSVEGFVNRGTVFRVAAAMGTRPDEFPAQWQKMPLTPLPEDCPLGQHWRKGSTSIHSGLEVRVARGTYGSDRVSQSDPLGMLLLWVRPKNLDKITVPFLAVLADLIPAGVGNALGINAGGNSLDITLRLTNTEPTEWVMVEINILTINAGLVHGSANLYNQRGELLGMASQSLILRVHSPDTK